MCAFHCSLFLFESTLLLFVWKDGEGITARIGKLEKMVIDLNAYRQRQEDELIEAQRLAMEMKKTNKYGSEELQQVIVS